MSWYNFQGPVQGGFGPLGAEDDERRRRRRDAYRDAGAPYAGGASGAPPADIAGLKREMGAWSMEDVVMPQDVTPSGPQQQLVPSAPRQAAAVDLGEGAVQGARSVSFKEEPEVFSMPQHVTAGGRDGPPRREGPEPIPIPSDPRGPQLVPPRECRRWRQGRRGPVSPSRVFIFRR